MCDPNKSYNNLYSAKLYSLIFSYVTLSLPLDYFHKIAWKFCTYFGYLEKQYVLYLTNVYKKSGYLIFMR